MAERKVVNKYYPQDFDPAKVPRRRMRKHQQIAVRMMLPMSIRCSTCGGYIYNGTKLNSRKEVIGETYYGIPIFRFYFKCTSCSAEIILKTDPRNSDYVVESGALRNFEPWRAEDEMDAEDVGDVMKSLEKQTLFSKRELDIMSAIDETRSMKSRHARRSVDAMLEAVHRSHQDNSKLEEEDEALIKSVFHKSKEFVRRIDDDDFDNDDNIVKKRKVSQDMTTDYLTKTAKSDRREELSRRIVLKLLTIKFSVVKKSSYAI